MSRAVAASWILLLVAGVVISVVSPLLSSPDEPVHLLRIWAVSRGNLVADTRTGEAGSALPCELGTFFGAVSNGDVGGTWRSVRDPVVQAASDRLKPSARPSDCFINYAAAAGYTPLAYLPPAAAMWLARLVDAGGTGQVLAARLASMIVSWLIIGAALKTAPRISWSILALSALPMAAFLRSVHVADSLLCALALLLVASVVRALDEGGAVGAAGVAAGALICLLKPPYLPISFATLLAGDRTLWRRRIVTVVFMLGATAAALLLWRSGHVGSEPVVPDAAQRLTAIVGSPLSFARLLVDDIVENGAAYRMSFIGVLGVLDAPVPPTLRLLLGVALMILILLESQRVKASLPVRVAAIALALGSIFVLQFVMYISWTPPGYDGIRGVQGRYFLPIVPLALVALPRFIDVNPRVVTILGACFVPFSLVVTIGVLVLRYWI